MERIIRPAPELAMRSFEIFGTLREPQGYVKGGAIYRQAEDARTFYWLKKGKIRIIAGVEDGREKCLLTCDSGEIFGMEGFFTGAPRITMAQAVMPCEVVSVDKELLELCREREPRLMPDMLFVQAETTRMMMFQAVVSAFIPAETRIVNHLLFLIKSGRTEFCAGKGHVVRGTQDYLAEYLGVSRVTVSRVLKKLREQGLIRTGYESVYICDTEKLECFAPRD